MKDQVKPSTPLSKQAQDARKPINPITLLSALQDNVYTQPRTSIATKVVRNPNIHKKDYNNDTL